MKFKYASMFWLMLLSVQMAIAQKTVTGKVTDKGDGSPLPGASILVKGGTQGVFTGVDGTFSLDVPNDAAVLVASFIGYANQEVTVGTETTINFALEQGVQLNTAVVTALGIKKEERSLGYAVSTVGGDDIAKSGEVNIIQSLSSKAAGIQVIGSGGTPGASSKILIRGNSTISGQNQPLIIIDGVPIDNSTTNTNGGAGSAGDNPFNGTLSGVNNSNRAIDINPDDIESVTILKGPAAAALYGVRAGNGAIIYTTKKGSASADGKLHGTFKTNIEFSTVNKLPELQDTYAQGNGGVFNTADYGPDNTFGTADDVSGGTSASWGPKISDDPDLQVYDNVGDFFQTGVSTNNSLSLMGGNQNTTFRLGIGNTRQQGIVPNTNFDRTSVRLTANTKLNEKFDVGATVSYINSGGIKAQNGSNLSGVMLGLMRAPASFNMAGEGEDGYKFSNGNQRQYFFPYDNSYWTAFENPFSDNINRIQGNTTTTYKATEWLTFTHRLGVDNYTDARTAIFAIGSWDPPNPTGQVEENVITSRQIYNDLLATATKSFSDDLDVSFVLGHNMWQSRFKDVYARGRNLAVDGLYDLGNASDLFADQYEERVRTSALFFSADINYQRWLYLTVTGRNEWASTFGPAKNNFFYPSANASIVFTEFMDNDEILSFGKLRLGYSQVGINPDPYNYNNFYLSPVFTDGFTDGLGAPFIGQTISSFGDILGNEALKPERVNGLEVGLDLRFLKGRAGIDVTLYNQETTDILISKPTASSSGFEAEFGNFGSLENRGVELLVTGTPVKTDKLQWDISVNYAKNVNEVTSLAPGVDEVESEVAFGSINSFAVVGEPLGVFFGTTWERNDNGDLIINPSTGLPLIAPTRSNVGSPYPDWQMGIRNTLTIDKNLSVGFLFDIRKGGSLWNGTRARLNRLGRTEESADRERDYTIEGVLAQVDGTGSIVTDEDGNAQASSTANNVSVDAQTYFSSYLGDGGGATEQFIEDGGWVRLREVTANYRLSLGESSKFFRYVDFSFTGRNLWLSTDYRGVDPETSLTGAGSNIGGFDYFNNPSTKSFIFGVGFGF